MQEPPCRHVERTADAKLSAGATALGGPMIAIIRC